MQLPTYLQIEPVGQCNLRCQMCSIPFRQDGPPHGPPAFMKWETFTRIIDDFDRLEHLHLQGLGEPMMHPRFFDMVSYAAAKGVRVTTNTNATLLNEDRSARCISSGLDCLHASLDGATARTFEQIRVRARFSKVVENLRCFQKQRERLGSQSPRLHVVFVAMRKNLAELAALVRLAAQLGAQEVFVQQLCHDFGESTLPESYRPMRNFVDDQALAAEERATVLRHFCLARAAARQTGIKLRLPHVSPRPHPAGTPGPKRCSWPWTGGYISYQGYMMPCCMVSTPDRMNFGNVSEPGSLAVWQSESFETFRAELSSDNPPEICSACSVYKRTF